VIISGYVNEERRGVTFAVYIFIKYTSKISREFVLLFIDSVFFPG
jgi:hypothetical protein